MTIGTIFGRIAGASAAKAAAGSAAKASVTVQENSRVAA
jgi:hypothetical protein